jgi:hypothetical protein
MKVGRGYQNESRGGDGQNMRAAMSSEEPRGK